MSGIGGGLSDMFGGQNAYQSSVQGPNQSLFQVPDQDANRAMLGHAMAQAQGAQAPTLQGATVAPGQQDQSRALQMGLASQLADQAAGRGPSLAGQQLQQGLQQQLMAQRAQAASARGGVNPYLLQRQVADQGAQAAQATNAQMAMARTQEQMNAQSALGSLAGQTRGQDQALAMQNAQFQQQAGMANQQANLSQQGINNQASQYAMSGMLGLSAQQAAANEAYAGMNQQAALANSQINAGVASQNAQNANAYGTAVFGGLAQGAGAALGGALFSDERLKENVDRSHVDMEMRDFLGSLDPASYDYKDPALGEGRHWSVMAQSAAKTPAGRSFVEETPVGLALDTRKATGVALAALAHLHRRQERLEATSRTGAHRG